MKALLLSNEYPPHVYGGAGVHGQGRRSFGIVVIADVLGADARNAHLLATASRVRPQLARRPAIAASSVSSTSLLGGRTGPAE